MKGKFAIRIHVYNYVSLIEPNNFFISFFFYFFVGLRILTNTKECVLAANTDCVV